MIISVEATAAGFSSVAGFSFSSSGTLGLGAGVEATDPPGFGVELSSDSKKKAVIPSAMSATPPTSPPIRSLLNPPSNRRPRIHLRWAALPLPDRFLGVLVRTLRFGSRRHRCRGIFYDKSIFALGASILRQSAGVGVSLLRSSGMLFETGRTAVFGLRLSCIDSRTRKIVGVTYLNPCDRPCKGYLPSLRVQELEPDFPTPIVADGSFDAPIS